MLLGGFVSVLTGAFLYVVLLCSAEILILYIFFKLQIKSLENVLGVEPKP